MSGRRGRALVPLSALCLALALPAAADAQSRRYPPPAEDADEDADAAPRSRFWERVVAPQAETYHLRLAAAHSLLATGDGAANAEKALAHARAAVALLPEHPRAHWLSAVAAERLGDWEACARDYVRVAELDPEFAPAYLPEGRLGDWALDLGLALCKARSGAYEAAISHLQRIAGRGDADAADAYLHLGSAYMALGRLHEAIDVLELAGRQARRDPMVDYALAAAYDRSEMPDQARHYLRRARARNASLALFDAHARFAPAEERLFQLGLSYAERDEHAAALLAFRRYLDQHDGPWQARGRAHATELAAALRRATAVSLSENDDGTRAAASAAVHAAQPALQRCVAPLPTLLFRVRVAILDRRHARNGVDIEVVDPEPQPPRSASEREARAQSVDDAVRCIERELLSLAPPALRPASGRVLELRFPLIAW
ncbi:tetratricopeptide repeat protein [Haliangium ochraceum]|uniref:Tetratricopeptide TPR_2 repeat protein n=1 Tax=Haliangium ochraceum (strain DSM 14365 / JCM 11303 / SMP-2) TaxID=502025 RepID=D0LJC2_HALO1|nr:tetratricopeptide repeat protein [Haliangium ochraceum]ACY14969.1 Tetratricopeptide TPR_2 repeat protein [Haliangium ochraceum DSM 14365]